MPSLPSVPCSETCRQLPGPAGEGGKGERSFPAPQEVFSCTCGSTGWATGLVPPLGRAGDGAELVRVARADLHPWVCTTHGVMP